MTPLTPRAACSLLLLLGLASPALASERPLLTSPSSQGITLGYTLDGQLGATGLMVQAWPTMLVIKAIAPGSPAARAGLPSPERFRVRIAAINGEPVEELGLAGVQRAFADSRRPVLITVGRKGNDDHGEMLLGPYNVGAAAGPRALTGDEQAARLLLQARQSLSAGEAELGAESALKVSPTNPLHARALEVHAEAQEAHQRELLAQADMLAALGNYSGALAAVKAVSPAGTWGELRRVREVDWQRTLAARGAMRDPEQRPETPESPLPAPRRPGPKRKR